MNEIIVRQLLINDLLERGYVLNSLSILKNEKQAN
jgi:hypothetical protein